MSWVALFGTPVVLAYQAWTFWVFRRRIGVEDIPPPAPVTGYLADVGSTP
jgi:cytochrome d ubiquinol oxidase subunit II